MLYNNSVRQTTTKYVKTNCCNPQVVYRQNRANLFVKEKSRFDGMHDCVMQRENAGFVAATASDGYKPTLGVNGVWVVGGDWITPFDSEGFRGYSVSNCCGSFVLAVRA